MTGYAHGGEDKSIGRADSAQECLDLTKNINPCANGITWESDSKKCFSEFGAKMISSVCETCKACIFHEGTFLISPKMIVSFINYCLLLEIERYNVIKLSTYKNRLMGT